MIEDCIINFMNCEYNLSVDLIEKSDVSTDGNVYILSSKSNGVKYIVKIYKDIEHVESITKLHTYLQEKNISAPVIIKNTQNNLYSKVNRDEYIVCYSYIYGSKLSDVELTDDIIKGVADYLRRLHDTYESISNLKSIPFEIKADRCSLLHFDITKQNIFINESRKDICFIDFDDAKFGPSVCDVAIAITNLFISKKYGVDRNGINLLIDWYYRDNEALKQKELPLIRDAAIKWVNSIINNPNFDTSTREGLQNKIEQMNKILG